MSFGPTEILIVLGIVVLLFGGRKLPELAKGAGSALRIFKDEVKNDETPQLEAEAKQTQQPEQG